MLCNAVSCITCSSQSTKGILSIQNFIPILNHPYKHVHDIQAYSSDWNIVRVNISTFQTAVSRREWLQSVHERILSAAQSEENAACRVV